MPVFERTRPRTPSGPTGEPGAGAFAQLYAEYFDPIYAYCRSRLGDAAAAEDAAGTVFARALAAGPRYGDPALRSWLFAIAHNVLANRHRAARPQAPLEAAAAIADPGPGLDDLVVANEERERLLRALRRLPDDQRRVVELRAAGLSGPDVARVLGRSHGAVKMLQLRAYARLREVLAEDAGDRRAVGHG